MTMPLASGKKREEGEKGISGSEPIDPLINTSGRTLLVQYHILLWEGVSRKKRPLEARTMWRGDHHTDEPHIHG